MDVDNDIDGQLLQQFSCMGTQDKEVLIAQFQNFLGNHINPENCAFYLDMNNWNLQAAIGSYYDFEQQSQNLKVPCMALVQDITIGEGESVPPNTPFVKTWRVKNSGPDAWPPGCCLHFINGVQFGSRDRVMVEALQPGAVVDISIDMNSPSVIGIHQGQWRMQTPTGLFFGEIIWVILHVEEHGLLGLTQQLSNISSSDINPQTRPHNQLQPNPFASPVKSETDTFVPAGQLSPVIGGLFGSPTPSLITHHGSLPCSPASSHTDHASAPVSSNLCTALFQTSPAERMGEQEPGSISSADQQPPSADMDCGDVS